MAKFATITVKALDDFNEFLTAAEYSAITAALATNGASSQTFGAVLDAAGQDSKYLILIHNSNSTANADPLVTTIKAGNGIQGNKDITVSLANGKFTAVTIESGRFKNVAENETLKALSSATTADQISAKGKVFITSTSNAIKVAVFKLP